MSWETRRDEARVTAPDEPKHRSRKDRRRWCRGKVGVEHERTLILDKNRVYHSLRWGHDSAHGAWCGWREGHAWSWVDGVRSWLGTGEWFWSCAHQYACANCGKILGKVGRECPEFHPHERDWKS